MLEGLQLTREQFIDVCILCGCDYCGQIRGAPPPAKADHLRRRAALRSQPPCSWHCSWQGLRWTGRAVLASGRAHCCPPTAGPVSSPCCKAAASTVLAACASQQLPLSHTLAVGASTIVASEAHRPPEHDPVCSAELPAEPQTLTRAAGIGPGRALSLIQKHGCIEKALDSLDPGKFAIPEPYPYHEARRLFNGAPPGPEATRCHAAAVGRSRWKLPLHIRRCQVTEARYDRAPVGRLLLQCTESSPCWPV